MTTERIEVMIQEVGKLSARVIALLGLELKAGQPIYLGESNIIHMETSHPYDYSRYGQYITDIILSPDYVGKNPKDGSIEYVKVFNINNDNVKVAVRLSGSGILYARSLYVLNPNRTANFIKKGTLKRYAEL